jgi:hypothetical protein
MALTTHRIDQCLGTTCVIHNPSDHHMRSWPMHWRPGRGIMERICSHGTGHPDPDQFEYWDRVYGDESWAMSVHGCDGCCAQDS